MGWLALTATLVGALATAILGWRLSRAKAQRDALALALDVSRRATDAAEANTRAERQARDAAQARLVNLISALRAEIDTLSKDLDACNSPGLVRARLRRLLSPPTPGGSTP